MAMPLIEDQALPGLALAMRVEPMFRNLATVIEARTVGAWSVAGGRLIRFRYRRGARAILQYELDIIGPNGPAKIPASAWLFAGGKANKHAGCDPAADPQALPPIVMEPASGALVYLFPADRHTPQVSRFLRGHTAFAAQLLRCEPTAAPEIVRYRPGLARHFAGPGRPGPSMSRSSQTGNPSRFKPGSRHWRPVAGTRQSQCRGPWARLTISARSP